MTTHLILLAAGEGTRMKSDRAKALHEIGGAPMFVHALASADELSSGRRVIVVGHGGDAVADAARSLDDTILIARQEMQLGTAHAVGAAASALDGAEGDALVLYGDTPFIRPETLANMADARQAGADIVILGFEAEDPARYGRFITEGDTLLRIVEWKDATEEERAVRLCNSGVVMADVSVLMDLVEAVGNNNASEEYYLTDIIEIGRARGLTTRVVLCDEAETLGVNSRGDLARAEAIFQARRRAVLLNDGVTLVAPETVHLSFDTLIGRDAVIEPNVVFGPGVTVETGALIRAFCHLEGCHIGSGAIVGPFARLRTGAEVSNGAKVGNFVEMKNATLGEGAKANHLSYIGDADVGPRANIGAGTITCNYDGVFKHRTEIGEEAFIGSDTMLVAPVRVGAGAMTASGTVVTKDVPDGALAVGRTRQDNKLTFATRFFEKLRAAKAANGKG